MDKAEKTEKKPIIGWFCTYTPEELILAAGLESTRILGKATDISKADAYLHPNLCAFVRASFGALLDGKRQELTGVVGVDSCDAMRRLFDACRYFLSPAFSHILSLPHRQTAEAAQFYRAELSEFAKSLHECFGAEFGEENLVESIALLNETRAILKELEKVSRQEKVVSDRQYYEIMLQAMTQPKRKFNQIWRRRLKQLTSTGPRSSNEINLILSGGVLDDLWIIDAIEQAGGHVVADDLCCGSRYFEGPVKSGGDPMLRIAERYIQRAPCARMSGTAARIERLLQLAEQTNAHGIVYYSIKFCDPHMLDWTMISQELHRKNIPALRCEADYSAGNREQIRTRIEAFLEMLR
jgi:benzoyl-CoA reductase/2-hydroxyglutaryl-CoA dehydratase subunit BcrC/BadD/HgdB